MEFFKAEAEVLQEAGEEEEEVFQEAEEVVLQEAEAEAERVDQVSRKSNVLQLPLPYRR